MENKKTLTALALHLVLISVPALGALLKLPDVGLYGVEVPPQPVLPTWTAWKDGDVQALPQRAMETRLALRGVFVRTENTLYELTGESKPGAAVVYGEHGTLIIIDDIHAFTRRRWDVVDELAPVRGLADLTADVHDELQRRGIPLVVIFTPSKTSIYPEDVPERWRLRTDDTLAMGSAPADAFRTRLTERGVRFTDSTTLMRARVAKDPEDRERLFSKYGRHWTPTGACIVLREALEPFVPELSCQTRTLQVPVSLHWDRDLYRLLNVWETRGIEDSVLPTAVVRPGSTLRPLVVGTSFSLGLVEWLRGAAADKVRFFYYNSTVRELSPGSTYDVGRVDPASPSWIQFTSDRNFVILEVLEMIANAPYVRDFLSAVRDRMPFKP